MRYSDYKDFPDFCNKNKLSPEQGLNFLLNEVIKLGEGKN